MYRCTGDCWTLFLHPLILHTLPVGTAWLDPKSSAVQSFDAQTTSYTQQHDMLVEKAVSSTELDDLCVPEPMQAKRE